MRSSIKTFHLSPMFTISFTISAVFLIQASVLVVGMAMNNMLMGQDLDAFLSGLVSFGELTYDQKEAILDIAGLDDTLFDANDGDGDIHDLHHMNFFGQESKEMIRSILYEEVSAGDLERETAEVIASALSLGGLYPSAQMTATQSQMLTNGPVQATYDMSTEGNMVRLGSNNLLNSSSRSGYNGIWGYAAGDREYALLCHGQGFSIIDVTNPEFTFRVQFVPMEGGGYWRDVATHFDSRSGKTFAYVGAQGTQGGGSNPNLFVFDLSYLSGSSATPNDRDSNPIPEDRGWVNLGYTDLTHTINVARGLLFLNFAGNSEGCNVYDLSVDPWNPRFLFNTGGNGGRDCHDSYVREDIDGRDILFVSEGTGRVERFYDITSVDAYWPTDKLPPEVGKTVAVSGIYAHESWLSEDNRYLFQLDEANSKDIIVHDVSDLTRPVQIAIMQYSEETQNSSGALPHNGEIRGNYLYVGYYEAGLRVFDISNPYLPVEVGKVETHRDPDGNGSFDESIRGTFAGAWNTYPFLPSGNILVSDMINGLFVVRADPPYSAPSKPILPKALKSSIAKNNDITVSWFPSSTNARGYYVERSVDGGGTYSMIAEHLVDATYVDTSAPGRGDVHYRIGAVNGEGMATSAVVLASREKCRGFKWNRC